ncbi:MAG: SIMPL domain-containing protein [Polaribacter sp.]|uniref:SIMPL domain-containing protein n=1 Tax=Polaribacter sp. TaxID=1920175 RepID=UPI002F36019D
MKTLKLLAILLFTTNLLSQTDTNNIPFIEVTGKAETEIVPDEIYLNISIKERMENGKKLKITFLENELKSKLREIGIPEKNLSISDVNAVLSKTGWWKEELLSIANYTLKIKGADKLKKLFEKLKKLKISDINISKVTHSKIIELRKKNRIKAIKVAKDKADYLLSAIGQKTGKPIIINEVNTNNQQIYANANYISSSSSSFGVSKSRGYSNEIVQFEKIKISSSIYVKFKIK